MVKPIQFGFMAVIFALSTPVFAKGERYGAVANFKMMESIEYEEGLSDEFNTISYGFVHTRPIDENNNRWRWWFGVNYLSDTTDTAENGIHQDVNNYEFRVVPQYALGKWNAFTPYIGTGLSMAYSQYSNRWQIENNNKASGTELEDINQFELGVVVSLATVIKLSDNPDSHLQIIPQASYIQPLYNDGIGGLELSVALLF